jgi:hypothetical protein
MVNVALQFRRGRLLLRVARYYQKEARERWELDQEWFRGRARKAAEKAASEKTPTDEGDTAGPR